MEDVDYIKSKKYISYIRLAKGNRDLYAIPIVKRIFDKIFYENQNVI